jgi:tetratricopeptide (TPR) repeat protein
MKPEGRISETPAPRVSSFNGDVRAHVQRVLRSDSFRAAHGLGNLLTFIVEEALAGRGGNLKEYHLGTTVLGRDASFDPKIDPIVRVQMRRLRQHLHEYYATEGRGDTIIIDLPKGTYLPTIQHHAPLPNDPDREARDRQLDGWSGFSAYEADLRARYLLGQRSVVSVRGAAALVEEIQQRQPSFAPAYATLAECYRMLTVLEMMPPAEVVPKMRAACEQALRLDASSSEAHAALAGVLAWEWNFTGAVEEYELAVRYGPQSAFAHLRYAIHLAATGRFGEAIDCAQRACELDPLSAACEHARGVVHYWTRDYRRALDCARRAVALAPQFGLGHHLLGFVCLHQHDYEHAVGALERATFLSGASTFDRGYQAYGVARAGEQAKARQILDQLVAAAQREYVAPLSIAHCHLGLGDIDDALTWIERAYVAGMSQWPYYLAAPFYEPLFRYKRFQSVLERIGLPRPLGAT